MEPAAIESSTAAQPAIDQSEDVFVFPVSYAQERLWFLDQLEPGSPLYNVPAVLPLPGPLNHATLQRVLNEIVRRHEVLRTTFAVRDGRPVQLIAPSLDFELPLIDLSTLSPAEQQTQVQNRVLSDAVACFDLTRGPLLRASLLHLNEREYLLVLNMHHIISDGWSMGVFFREMAVLYESFALGQPSPLGELPIQYADYAVWQRDYLKDEVLERQLDYWRKQLAGAPVVLDLASGQRRPEVQSYRGRSYSFLVAPETVSRLRVLTQQADATLFMTLLAVFNVLLHRYTGSDDVVVGTPIANRNRSELEGLIGFFTNTLVLRTDASGNPTFRELLRRVQELTLAAYEHQDLPFERLVEELKPERSLSHNPLFQVMFALQNLPGSQQDSASAGSGSGGLSQGGTGTAKFDLSLFLSEMNEGLVGAFEYNCDLFDDDKIVRMVAHFTNLLERIAANPDRRLSDLPMLSAAERQQIVVDWNSTLTDLRGESCIHRSFEAQVKKTPDAVAVTFLGAQITYRELDHRANQLAHYLRRLAVGPEVCVGICVDRSPEMIIGVLGILKAGGAYVPLDPNYPSDRLAFMLSDADVAVVLTDERSLEKLPPTDATVIRLDREAELLSSESDGPPVTDVSPDNLAYVIYTSGSTGKPKGVAMTHRTLSNLFSWQIRTSDLRGDLPGTSRTLQFASLSFDVSCQEIFVTLCSGGMLVLITDEDRKDVDTLWRCLKNENVQRLFLPPVALHQLAESRPHSESLPVDLREIIVAGEQLQISPAIVELFSLLSDCRLRNHYGPAEAHVVSEYVLAGPASDWPVFPAIGRPISNLHVHLLDSYLQPVPVGVMGEIYIGGEAARGYLRAPGPTAEKFIPDPYSGRPGARLYKTGDLGRYRNDGNIEFFGRADAQIKMRGFRIEPGEIEAVLVQHPSVVEAAVVAREDRPGNKRLVAYIVLDPAQQPPATPELRSFLNQQLPEHMLPSAFVILDALPLSPNGKLDRKALPAPDPAGRASQRTFVAPRSPLEETLSRIWAEALNLDRVSIDDNFFELGGHSLMATQVISHTRAAFDVDMSVRSLFKAPTVAEFAVAIMQHKAQQMNIPDLAQMLEAVAELSEAEVELMLSRESVEHG